MTPLVPAYIYKIISEQAWKESQGQLTVPLSANDAEFIHFSTSQQVENVVKKFWANEKFVILAVKTAELPGKLVFEENRPGGEKYYHLYDGSIPQKNAQLLANTLEQYLKAVSDRS